MGSDGGRHSTVVAFALLTQLALVLISALPNSFGTKVFMTLVLLSLIDDSGQSRVDSGLKMLIKPI